MPKPYNEILYNISALAYKALSKKQLTFNHDEITEACPVTNGNERAVINGLGLIQTAEFFAVADGNTETLSNFAHYSVQELLAAWHIAFHHEDYFRQFSFACSIQKKMQKCLQCWFQQKELIVNFWKGDFINMWSFYIGLTEGKDCAFKHFISGKNLCDYVQRNQCVISKEILESKIKTLLLYFLLQEAPDNEMIKYLDTVVSHSKLDVSGEPLGKKEDLHLLGYILSRPYLTKQWKFVDISQCGIDDEKFKVLHEILTRNDGRPKPEIKSLSLSGMH